MTLSPAILSLAIRGAAITSTFMFFVGSNTYVDISVIRFNIDQLFRPGPVRPTCALIHMKALLPSVDESRLALCRLRYKYYRYVFASLQVHTLLAARALS